MRHDLYTSFRSGTPVFFNEMKKSLSADIDYTFSVNTGHAKSTHTYTNGNEFLQKTALRLCSEKETHENVSVLASHELIQPILSEMFLASNSRLNELSEWIQNQEHLQKYVFTKDFGYDTGFVVDKNMTVHQTSGITLVFQRATDSTIKELCPFGFYLATAYPAADEKFYTNTLGTLNRYGVLDVLRKQLPTRLEQAAFLHSGDHDDVKVEIVENIAHEKRIRLIYQEYKNDEMYRHVVNIKPNGQGIYHCKKLEENPTYTKNLKVDCPVLYKIAIAIRNDLQMEDRKFEHRIAKDKIENQKILSAVQTAEQDILSSYIEDELLKAPTKEIYKEQNSNYLNIEDRFAVSTDKPQILETDLSQIQVLTNIDEEIANIPIHSQKCDIYKETEQNKTRDDSVIE